MRCLHYKKQLITRKIYIDIDNVYSRTQVIEAFKNQSEYKDLDDFIADNYDIDRQPVTTADPDFKREVKKFRRHYNKMKNRNI